MNPFFGLPISWRLVLMASCAMIAPSVSLLPQQILAQSGYVQATCNYATSRHYADKAVQFMQAQKWDEATWALSAAWNSQATCSPTTRLPLWA